MRSDIGVYKIELPSGSIYIGMTSTGFEGRWQGHIKELRNGRHKCRGLKRAYKKYGEENLDFSIIEEFPVGTEQAQLLLAECRWWDYYDSLGVNIYNGRPSGTGSVIHTPETRAAIGRSISNNFREEHEERVCCRLDCGKTFNVTRKSSRKSCFDHSGHLGSIIASRRSDIWNNHDLVDKFYNVDGLTTAAIGGLFGISQQSAYRAMRKMNILVPGTYKTGPR